jgi:hypothetical protein
MCSFPSGYNIRTSTSWAGDTALACTYFPRFRLTYGILFGITDKLEEQVLSRLSRTCALQTHIRGHPLLIPGLVLELERIRMDNVFNITINNMESDMLALLYYASSSLEDGDDIGKSRIVTWLRTANLRSHLDSWKSNLGKAARHCDELMSSLGCDVCGHQGEGRSCCVPPNRIQEAVGGGEPEVEVRCLIPTNPSTRPLQPRNKAQEEEWRQVCISARQRISAIMEHLDEDMKSCDLKLEGMLFATQCVSATYSIRT